MEELKAMVERINCGWEHGFLSPEEYTAKISQLQREMESARPVDYDELMEAGADLLLQTVDELIKGSLKEIPQSHQKDILHQAPKIFTETCQINWGKSIDDIYNLIRGLSPYPAAFTFLNLNTLDAAKLILKSGDNVLFFIIQSLGNCLVSSLLAGSVLCIDSGVLDGKLREPLS